MGKLLFLAIKLSVVGTLTVVVIWVVVALGWWKRNIAFRVMTWFSLFGALIPLLILLVAPALRGQVGFQSIMIVVWPSSPALMGLDGPGSTGVKLLTVAVLILMNAGLYGFLGLCVGAVWQVLRGLVKEAH